MENPHILIPPGPGRYTLVLGNNDRIKAGVPFVVERRPEIPTTEHHLLILRVKPLSILSRLLSIL